MAIRYKCFTFTLPTNKDNKTNSTLKSITMYTNKSISLTAKCQAILTLIQRVNNKLERNIVMLKEFNQSPFCVGPGKYGIQVIEGYIQNNKEVITRLGRYYTNTVAQLADEASKQFFPLAA